MSLPARDGLPAEYLTARQICEILQISPTKLRDLVRRKQLPEPLRFGYRCRRWHRRNLEAALQKLMP